MEKWFTQFWLFLARKFKCKLTCNFQTFCLPKERSSACLACLMQNDRKSRKSPDFRFFSHTQFGVAGVLGSVCCYGGVSSFLRATYYIIMLSIVCEVNRQRDAIIVIILEVLKRDLVMVPYFLTLMIDKQKW